MHDQPYGPAPHYGAGRAARLRCAVHERLLEHERHGGAS
jgi:hypothetical protein